MNRDLDVIVFTSNKHLWALQPFAWLFNKYWSPDQKVIVVGFSVPEFELPKNFFFYSVSDTEYPADKWANQALDFFNDYQSSHFIMFHEDYWLVRNVDIDAVRTLHQLAVEEDNIIRIDLTADRLYAGGMKDCGYYGRFDLVEAKDSQYQMSHQACIMNTTLYKKVISALPEDNRSAWNVELAGTTIVNAFGSQMKVLGTRQLPVRYANALLKGKLDWNELPKLDKEDYDAIRQWIPEHYFGDKKNANS